MNEYNILASEIFYFRVVYERKSLSGAARQLGQDSANLSRMITRLERNLGSALFVRHKSGLHPTDTADRLYSAIQAAMSSYSNEFLFQSQSLRRIRIGFSSSIGFAHFSKELTKAMLSAQLNPEFQIDSSFQVIEKLKSRELDLAIVHSWVKFPGVISKKIRTEDIVLCGQYSEESKTLVLHPDMLGLEKIVASIAYQQKWLLPDYFVIAKVVSENEQLMGLLPKPIATHFPQLKIIENYAKIATITAVTWPGSVGGELLRALKV